MDLEKLKKDYSEIQKKFSLVSFEEMNQDFHIEKLSEVETDYLIREIRKFLTEKLQNYARFIETVLNPANASLFIFSLVKTLETKQKEALTEVYKKLVKQELELVGLDLEFSEEKEAEYVKKVFSLWQDIKKDMLDVFKFVRENWDKEADKGSKAYFG